MLSYNTQNQSVVINKNNYIEGLDGFRAIAVILVLFVHYGYLNFGWIGVQMFFVLSGFLITKSLILSKKLPLKSYYRSFILKRVLRIFPLYFLYLGIFFVLRPHQIPLDGKITLISFTSNYYPIFNPDANWKFVGHYWSLAVEEQFYLIWPFIVYFLLPFPIQKKGTSIFVFFIFIGLLARLITYFAFKKIASEDLVFRAIYAFSTSHFDAFSIGGLLAYMRFDQLLKLKKAFIPVIIICILIGIFNLILQINGKVSAANLTSFGYPYLLKENFQFVYGYTLLNMCFGLVIVKILIEGWGWLENKYLSFIGKVSFGIYVLHVPVLEGLNEILPVNLLSPINLIKLPLFLGITIGLSFISYRYLERPFLKMKNFIK